VSFDQAFDGRHFLLRQEFSLDFVDADLVGDALCDALVVARQHDDMLHTERTEVVDHLGSVRANGVGEGEPPQYSDVAAMLSGDEDARFPLCL